MAIATGGLKSKRGRPSLERASAIDRMIMSQARSLFLAEGFDAVSMEQIAAATNISKGTLYARHSSKEDLFAAVTLDIIAQSTQSIEQNAHLMTDDLEQRLRLHARLMVGSLMTPEVIAFQRMLQGVQHRFPELAEAVTKVGYRYLVNIMRDDIQATAARDGQVVRDAEGVALMIVSSIGGYDMFEVSSGRLTIEQLQTHADRTIDLAMAARAAW